ncbi:uncharacterized protein LOC110849803 isoform X2 [Folsomia candida]|uniref:Death domain-containing protein n=1 Tax=Folsomia candida TaxID=158441 RepID=A0A226ECA7_FOLCA|nr:uncharacterized protein LOC110849803 isoform X2 [Folsomia candida]OXA55080.1 hypothetical protein Fcan01_11345 [Folsomia candida]
MKLTRLVNTTLAVDTLLESAYFTNDLHRFFWQLGLSDYTISDINKNYDLAWDKVHKGLQAWQKINASSATVEQLVSILKSLKNLDAAGNQDQRRPGSSSTIPQQNQIANSQRLRDEPDSQTNSPLPHRRSELDSKLMITEDIWVLWLIRRPEEAKHPQHSFLVLEGREGEQNKTFFFDFVTQHKDDIKNPGLYKGKVQIDAAFGNKDELGSPLLHFGIKALMRLTNTKPVGEKWMIRKDIANKLIQNVLESWRNPPPFNVAGSESLLAQSSAHSYKDEVGHNCYTWAAGQIKKLRELDDIIELPENLLQLIITVPSTLLVDSPNPVRKVLKRVSKILLAKFTSDTAFPFLLLMFVLFVGYIYKPYF